MEENCPLYRQNIFTLNLRRSEKVAKEFFGGIKINLTMGEVRRFSYFSKDGKVDKRSLPTFLLLLFQRWKSRQKILADMNASRSVRPLTAAAKVNWALSRFCTPL